MITTRRIRPRCTPSLGRILAAALVLSALLAAVPPPAQALPLGGDGPLAGLLSWFEGLLADLGFAPEGSTELEPAFLPGGCDLDPVGGTCSQGVTAPVPAVQGGGKSLVDRPAIK